MKTFSLSLACALVLLISSTASAVVVRVGPVRVATGRPAVRVYRPVRPVVVPAPVLPAPAAVAARATIYARRDALRDAIHANREAIRDARQARREAFWNALQNAQP